MRATLAVLLFVAPPALAMDAPSFDCTKAESGAEELVCADPALARLDRRLAERYAQALAAVRALDAGAEEAEAHLRATQRGWIGGRDECWKAADTRACVEDAYLRREGALVSRWLLEEASGTATWLCGGNGAGEVVTMFFDTPRPSVRLERGDTIDTGSLTRTASGSRYDGSFGRFIWIKGDEALYREADPDGTEWDCTRATPG